MLEGGLERKVEEGRVDRGRGKGGAGNIKQRQFDLKYTSEKTERVNETT